MMPLLDTSRNLKSALLYMPVLAAPVFVASLGANDVFAQSTQDRVRLHRGSESGEVTSTTRYIVTLSKGSSSNEQIAVNQIKSIVFGGEPSELSQARVHAQNGNYEKALEMLNQLDSRSVRRDLVKQDIAFYKAWSAAKLALAGKAEIGDAGRQLNSFVRAHPDNYHHLAAVEMMGDLLMASDRFEPAQKQYAELAEAPWPDYKMRAAVAIGRSLQAQKRHTEAIAQFDAALAIGADTPEAKNQHLAATLGKAISTAEAGSLNEAVAAIERVIGEADPEQKQLHARAYNALGTCYEKAGKTKDALLAFLHVDVLYNSVPEAHAEALAHLVPIWQALGQNERAREARQVLEERYGGSRWATSVE